MAALTNLKSLLDALNEIDVKKTEPEPNSSPSSIVDLYVKVSHWENAPRFKNHKYIAMFGINERFEREVNCSLQYLNLPISLDNLDISLDGGFEGSKLMVEHAGENGYKRYRKVKYENFLKWIVENDYSKKVSDKEKPTFIGLSGNIAQLMITPFEIQEDWVIHVVRQNNLIFIDKIASPSKEKIDNARKAELLLKGEAQNDKPCYHAFKFLQLIATDSKEAIDENRWLELLNKSVNNYERQFDILETDFGDFPFLILHDMKAIDPIDDSRVDVKLVTSTNRRWYTERFRNYTTLQMWGRAVVSGVSKFICGEREFGNRNRTGLLKRIKIYKIQDLESIGSHWSPDVCYNFLDRLLNYIVQNVPCDNSLQTYQLKWKLRENKVTCERFDGHLIKSIK